MTTGTYGVDDAAVVEFLDRARTLVPAEVARLNAYEDDRHRRTAWVGDVARLRAALGWNDEAHVDDTLRAARAATIDHHAAAFRAWTAAAAIGRDAGIYPVATLSLLGWTAVALAARHLLPPDLYAAVTDLWQVEIGRPHPDDPQHRAASHRRTEEVAAP